MDWCHFAHEYQTCKSHKIQILSRGKNLAHNMAQQFKYELKKQFQIFTVISINHFYCLSHSYPIIARRPSFIALVQNSLSHGGTFCDNSS